MKKFASLTAAFILGLTLVGCAGTPEVSYTKADADAAISAAKAANKKAKSVNFEWRDTGKIIKKAEKAAKDGDFQTAVKLAKKAEKQGQNAYQQYVASKNAGPRM